MGSLRGKKGIHGFWESRLPELFAGEYDFFVGKASYISDIYLEAWDAVLESHKHVAEVLDLERQLSVEFPASKKYGYESRNNLTVRTYSREYSRAYHGLMEGMVEARMRRAIYRIGSFWYTAWRLAGSPDLSSLRKNGPLESAPVEIERKLKIEDREEFDLGYRFGRPGPQAKPMGLYRYLAGLPVPTEERDHRKDRDEASSFFRKKQVPWLWEPWQYFCYTDNQGLRKFRHI